MTTQRIPRDPTGSVRVEILDPKDIRSLDEVVIGNWLHLERLNGDRRRTWWLGLTDERGEVMHVYIQEKDGAVTCAHVTERWPPKEHAESLRGEKKP